MVWNTRAVAQFSCPGPSSSSSVSLLHFAIWIDVAEVCFCCQCLSYSGLSFLDLWFTVTSFGKFPVIIPPNTAFVPYLGFQSMGILYFWISPSVCGRSGLFSLCDCSTFYSFCLSGSLCVCHGEISLWPTLTPSGSLCGCAKCAGEPSGWLLCFCLFVFSCHQIVLSRSFFSTEITFQTVHWLSLPLDPLTYYS